MKNNILVDEIIDLHDIDNQNKNFETETLNQIDREELINFLVNHYRDSLQNVSNTDLINFVENNLNTNQPIKLIGIKETDEDIVYPYSRFDQNFIFSSDDPQTLASEMRMEIETSNEIKLLVSFITSGWNILENSLRDFTNRGGKLRIITTTYMGNTDFQALYKIAHLPNTLIKIEKHPQNTRLHAKVYGFNRNYGPSSVYIGSSNISRPALESGLEWNIKLTSKTDKKVINKFNTKFEEYWCSDQFIDFDINNPHLMEEIKNDLSKRKKDSKNLNKAIDNVNNNLNFEISLRDDQEKILKQLDEERKKGNYKNLVVLPTGVGKTIIAAFDYKRFYNQNNSNNKLLFVIHRNDILTQARDKFRLVLDNDKFGEVWNNNSHPKNLDYLFCNIFSLNALRKEMEARNIDINNYYDYIIIDEAHHSAANEFKQIFEFNSKILLGLTATPDRGDDADIYQYFNNTISASMSLREALDLELLTPFNYFYIYDEVDYDNVDINKRQTIAKNFINNINRDKIILKELGNKVFTDLRAIAFCASVSHGQEMERLFNNNGYKAKFIYNETKPFEREDAIRRLELSKDNPNHLDIICTKDLFNEGIDIPCVNTLLLLRPTESKTIFTQQLGRGLRKYEHKDVLTVLDFVGNNENDFLRSEYIKDDFIFGKNINKNKEHIRQNYFDNLPLGCNISVDKKIREEILQKIDNYANNYKNIINFVKNYIDNHSNPNLKDLLNNYNFNLKLFYSKTTFTDLLNGNSTYDNIKKLFLRILEYRDIEVLEAIKEYLNFNIGNGYKSIFFTTNNKGIDNLKNNLSIEYKKELNILIDYILENKKIQTKRDNDKYIFKLNCSYSQLVINNEFNKNCVIQAGGYRVNNNVILFIDGGKNTQNYDNVFKDNYIKWYKQTNNKGEVTNSGFNSCSNEDTIFIFSKEKNNLFKYLGIVKKVIDHETYKEFYL